MKAAVYTKTGSGKVLEIEECEKPTPNPDEVLLRVRAASVNPLDWRLKSERPGVDVAGEVVAAGSAVTQFKIGEAVFGAGKGTFGEFACAPEKHLARKPDYLNFEEAAAIPIAGLTALQALRDKGHLQRGQKVLINGAAGGIGTFSIQVAKSFGAQVTGVCSTKNLALVRSLGADRVIDYSQEDFTRDRERYDVLLDNVGNRSLSDMKRVLKDRSKCVMAGAPKRLSAVATRLFKAYMWSPFLRQKFQFFIANVNRDDLLEMCRLVKEERLTVVLDQLYPLADAADAMAYVEQGHARAKVVITVP